MKVLLICFMTLIVNTLTAQGVVFENDSTSWQTILNKAKTNNKLVFVDGITTWCAPCKRMAKEVFIDKKVGDFFNTHFVNVKLDMEKGDNPLMAKRYGIEVYPTYLFINADNELVHKGTSFTPIDAFLALGNAAIDPKNQFETLKNQFRKGNCSTDFLKKFSYLCSEKWEDSLAIEASKAYLATQKDWLSTENKVFIKDFATWIENPAYRFVLDNKDVFKNEFGWKFIAGLEDYMPASNTFRRFFDRDKNEFDALKVDAYLNTYLPKELAEKTQNRLKIWQFEAKNDTINTLKSTITFFETYSITDPRLFSRFANVFYDQATDKIQLEKAIQWALKSVELDDNYNHNSITASLYFKLKNKIKAKEYALKALEKAKDDKDDYKEGEILLKKIEAM
jgi:thioredoxin-related protein